jgi:nucleotide-binding universal stress UspA family protein
MTAVPPPAPTKKLLVIADGTLECRLALRYAARRAQHTDGRLCLLYVIEPIAGQEWMAVEERMRAEAREEAERLLYELAEEANMATGLISELIIREGGKKEEIAGLIRGEPDIRLLVLGADAGREGPGPLVSSLVADIAALYTVPVTVVPGGMSIEAIDALA